MRASGGARLSLKASYRTLSDIWFDKMSLTERLGGSWYRFVEPIPANLSQRWPCMSSSAAATNGGSRLDRTRRCDPVVRSQRPRDSTWKTRLAPVRSRAWRHLLVCRATQCLGGLFPPEVSQPGSVLRLIGRYPNDMEVT
jgi:hypothetical protein